MGSPRSGPLSARRGADRDDPGRRTLCCGSARELRERSKTRTSIDTEISVTFRWRRPQSLRRGATRARRREVAAPGVAGESPPFDARRRRAVAV